MSASVIGIILSIFAILVSVLIYWGGFKEEQRAISDGEGPSH